MQRRERLDARSVSGGMAPLIASVGHVWQRGVRGQAGKVKKSKHGTVELELSTGVRPNCSRSKRRSPVGLGPAAAPWRAWSTRRSRWSVPVGCGFVPSGSESSGPAHRSFLFLPFSTPKSTSLFPLDFLFRPAWPRRDPDLHLRSRQVFRSHNRKLKTICVLRPVSNVPPARHGRCSVFAVASRDAAWNGYLEIGTGLICFQPSAVHPSVRWAKCVSVFETASPYSWSLSKLQPLARGTWRRKGETTTALSVLLESHSCKSRVCSFLCRTSRCFPQGGLAPRLYL